MGLVEAAVREERLLRPPGLRRDLGQEAAGATSLRDLDTVASELDGERVIQLLKRIEHRYLYLDVVELLGPDAVAEEPRVLQRHLEDAFGDRGVRLEVAEAAAELVVGP